MPCTESLNDGLVVPIPTFELASTKIIAAPKALTLETKDSSVRIRGESIIDHSKYISVEGCPPPFDVSIA